MVLIAGMIFSFPAFTGAMAESFFCVLIDTAFWPKKLKLILQTNWFSKIQSHSSHHLLVVHDKDTMDVEIERF